MQTAHDGFFRSLCRTAVGERRLARAIAHVAHDVATLEPARSQWPTITFPRTPVSLDASEETIDPSDA